MPRIEKRIHRLFTLSKTLLYFAILSFCPFLWAAQDAIVIADKAVVYADKTMSAPVGYVVKGKRITIGEIARNKSQVYPIVVSGKIAYIRTIDVSTEMESIDSNRLVAERFVMITRKQVRDHYAASFYTYPSQITLERSVDKLEDKDAFVWNGFQVTGSREYRSRFDLGLVIGYAEGKQGIETFRMTQLGPDLSFRIYSGDRFIVRWQNQLTAVPFASYSLGTQARVNGYGFGAGTGLNANWVIGERWGLEVYGGLQYTKLYGFDLPDPRNATSKVKYPDIEINPSFVGTRLGIGGTYQF